MFFQVIELLVLHIFLCMGPCYYNVTFNILFKNANWKIITSVHDFKSYLYKQTSHKLKF